MNTDEKLDLLLNNLDDIPTKIDLVQYIKDSGLETDRKIAELSDKYSKNLSEIVRAISIYNTQVSFKTTVSVRTDCHTTSEHGSNESVESNGSIGYSSEDLDDVEEVKSILPGQESIVAVQDTLTVFKKEVGSNIDTKFKEYKVLIEAGLEGKVSRAVNDVSKSETIRTNYRIKSHIERSINDLGLSAMGGIYSTYIHNHSPGSDTYLFFKYKEYPDKGTYISWIYGDNLSIIHTGYSIIDKSGLAAKKSDEEYERYKMRDFDSLIPRSTYVLCDCEDLTLLNEDVQGRFIRVRGKSDLNMKYIDLQRRKS